MFEPLLILGMFAATFVARYPVLALASRVDLPQNVVDALKFIPPAVLTAIILPAVLYTGENGALAVGLSNIFLVAGAVAVIVSWRTKNLLLTITVGMATLCLLMWRA